MKENWCKKEECMSSSRHGLKGIPNKDYSTNFYCSSCNQLLFIQPKDELTDVLLKKLDNFDLLKQIYRINTLEYARDYKKDDLTFEEEKKISQLADEYYDKGK